MLHYCRILFLDTSRYIHVLFSLLFLLLIHVLFSLYIGKGAGNCYSRGPPRVHMPIYKVINWAISCATTCVHAY